MRLNHVLMLVSAVCLALLAAPTAEAKNQEKVGQQRGTEVAKKKDPDTVIKVIDLAKAKAKAVKKLEKAVKKVKGVTVVVVAKKKNEVKIWHKPDVAKADLEAAITSQGFKIEGGEGEGGEDDGGDDEPAPPPAEPEEDEGGGGEYEEE